METFVPMPWTTLALINRSYCGQVYTITHPKAWHDKKFAGAVSGTSATEPLTGSPLLTRKMISPRPVIPRARETNGWIGVYTSLKDVRRPGEGSTTLRR